MREPKDITLFDIFSAVEKNGLFNHDFDTCPRCNIALGLKTAAEDAFFQIEHAAFDEMKKLTLQTVLDRMPQSSEGV